MKEELIFLEHPSKTEYILQMTVCGNYIKGTKEIINAIKECTFSLEEFKIAINNSNDFEEIEKLYSKMKFGEYFKTYNYSKLLIIAIEYNYIEIVNYLIEELNVDVNIPYGDYSDHPLICAINNNQLHILKYLIQQGAKTDIKNRNGLNLVDIAKLGGNVEIIEYLTNKLNLNKSNFHYFYDEFPQFKNKRQYYIHSGDIEFKINDMLKLMDISSTDYKIINITKVKLKLIKTRGKFALFINSKRIYVDLLPLYGMSTTMDICDELKVNIDILMEGIDVTLLELSKI